MIIEVDRGSAVPPFEQIRVQIAALVERGVLVVDQRLPTIAQLANDLAIAPGTVARAYRELERDGLLISRRRVGTVVAPNTRAPVKNDPLDRAVVDFVRQLRQLGTSPEEAVGRVRALWNG
jgi:GntR family transcriptional regulator